MDKDTVLHWLDLVHRRFGMYPAPVMVLCRLEIEMFLKNHQCHHNSYLVNNSRQPSAVLYIHENRPHRPAK